MDVFSVCFWISIVIIPNCMDLIIIKTNVNFYYLIYGCTIMLNKKIIFTFVFLITTLFVYAESEKLTYWETKRTHHEFTINNNGKQNRYRIQMNVSHYAFFIDAESCACNECFPNFEMGISREEGSKNYSFPNYSAIWIFPDIIIKDENLRDDFFIKGVSRQADGYLFKCNATNWEVYEKGLVLDIWKEESNKLKRVYLELKDDGKYYETDNTEKLGELKKSYSAYDFLDKFVYESYSSAFYFFGYSIYKMGSGRNIESVLISNILYYNTTKDGIEFITPYGCGFFDFKTESMSLVPKEKYLGREFTYTPDSVKNEKLKEEKKIIAEEDFIIPDIRVPLKKYDLDYYFKRKQVEKNQKEQEQLLRTELLLQ